ncbi:hypothetical protein N9980_00530 [bacterium]|nr:hypothetical protein [bacterium]
MDKAKKKYRDSIAYATGKASKAALTKALVYAAGASKELAPREYGTLVNSQFRSVEKINTGWRGTLGYAVSYAAILENPKAGGKMDNWQPVAPENKLGPDWNPMASQGFLKLGFLGLESRPAIEAILQQGIKLK